MKQSDLCLSAQRAFLGRIHRGIRLIKIKAMGPQIILTVVVAGHPNEQLQEDISEAATEIIADFPDAARIIEHIERSDQEIATEDILQEGWVYRRAE